MKIIIIFFTLFLITTITSRVIYSATPTIAPSVTPVNIPSIQKVIPGLNVGDVPLPGVNCGDFSSKDPKIKKCCFNKPMEDPSIKTLTGLSKFPAIISNILDSIFPKVMEAMLHNQREAYINPCINGSPSDLNDPSNCICVDEPDDPLETLVPLCKNIKSDTEREECEKCFKGEGSDKSIGVWTGVGCIYANTKSFIEKTIFGWGIGMAGSLALLCIIYSAFQIQISQGNPEKLKKAQEMLTSCIVGLMLIIFSVFILKFIGVDILKIPFT